MLLQLTGSYFCSVTSYDMLASFTALITICTTDANRPEKKDHMQCLKPMHITWLSFL